MLVVAPEPVFTPRGTPFSVYHRLSVASELGVVADLLTYESGADPDIPNLTVHRIPRIPLLRPVRVGPSFGKLIRDVMMVVWTIALLVRKRPDVVHAHEEAVFWCRALKPLFGYRLIYDMHSSLPEQLVNFEFSRNRLLIGLFRWLEGVALRGADAVLTISPSLAGLAVRRMSDPSRHLLLENSLLESVRLRASGQDASRDWPPDDARDEEEPFPEDWRDRPVILYAGTLEAYQGIGMLLDAFARVHERRPECRLLVLGGTRRQIEHYRAEAAVLGLDEAVCIHGPARQRTVREVMRRSAVLVSPRVRGNNTPLKVYELLASGVPFVATRIEAHTQVLDDTVCVLAEPDPAAFAEGLIEALDGGEPVERRTANAARLYEERYSREAYRKSFGLLLDRLSHSRPGLTASA